jgi:hypothetical protein
MQDADANVDADVRVNNRQRKEMGGQDNESRPMHVKYQVRYCTKDLWKEQVKSSERKEKKGSG